jgi:hypothetical protein
LCANSTQALLVQQPTALVVLQQVLLQLGQLQLVVLAVNVSAMVMLRCLQDLC